MTPKKEFIQDFANYSLAGEAGSEQASSPQAQVAASASSPHSATPQASNGERVLASPLAKTFASEKGVSLSSVKIPGSGVEGSITKKDVQQFLESGQQAAVQQKTAAQAPAAQKEPVQAAKQAPVESGAAKGSSAPVQNPYTDIELTNMRLTIANRLLESKTTIPHYYLTMSINMDKVLK